MGKTALLDYAARSCEGCTVIRAGGVESEMELPFAALHQLCMPLLDGLERLPRAPARRAANGFRPDVGSAPRSFPRRPRGADPALGRGRTAAADLRRRRRAMARPLLGPGPVVRGTASPGGVGDRAVRRARPGPTDRAGRAAGTCVAATVGCRRTRAARLVDSRTARRTRPSADHRRGTREPARVARAASRCLVGESRRRLCGGGFVAAREPRGGELSASGRPATRGDATPAAPRCGRTDRRSNAPLASRCRAWYSDRSGCSCRSGRSHRCRYASHVPPPTAPVGDLRCCVPRQASKRASGAGRGHRCRARS